MASWFAVYRTADGTLVSTGTVVANPLPAGLTAKDFGAAQTGIWNKTTKVFDPAPVLKAVLSLKDFWNRFTVAEREALMNLQLVGTQTQKNKLGAFKSYVSDVGLADLNDAYIQSSVNLLESVGIIAAGRAAVILA
jgi:hypothetical protein